MTTISMCMIVKNEETILKRCLDSYAGTYDELIIVDTGSTDNTRSIAALYTDKIYDYTWIDDFADARNFAFSKATCEYIFSADADEVLDVINHKAFLELKSLLLPEIEIVQMKYVNACDHNDVYNAKKEYRPKLFKRMRSFTWISPIHETVRLSPVIYDSDIEILHMPEKSHSKRDFSTFIKAINRGCHLQDYVVIMFCKELYISGTDEDFLMVQDIFINILAYEDRSFECSRNIMCVLARIYRLTDNKDAFYRLCINDIENTPSAEICMELGINYYNVQDYFEAIRWFNRALTEADSIIDIRSNGSLPLSYLAKCYKALNKLAVSSYDFQAADEYKQLSINYQNQADSWQYPDEL